MNGQKQKSIIEITPDIKKDLDLFKKKMGYECNLENPISHAEHIMRKKYIDRNPLLVLTSDKIKVRTYIREKLGTDDIVGLKFETYSVESALSNIKPPCVLKINNASGKNIFVFDKNHDKEEIRNKLIKWMNESYGEDKGEWCYQKIKPGIVIEPLLFHSGHIIYRFLTFNGVVKYIHAHKYTFKKVSGILKPVMEFCTTYDRDWNLIDVKYKNLPYKEVIKPLRLSEMIEISEKLGEPFDFVRVDLYETKNGIIFSELTHYPVSGKCNFVPSSFDYELGKCWTKEKESKKRVFCVYFDDSSHKFTEMKKVMEYSFHKHHENIKFISKCIKYPKMSESDRKTHVENIYKLKYWNQEIQKIKVPTLLIDCDLLFLDNIEQIFETECDLLFTDRTYSSIKYNAGVVLVKPTQKAKDFFKEWYRISKEEFDINNEYWLEILKRAKGITQSTLTHMIESGNTSNCDIGFIPCYIWNCAGSDFIRYCSQTKILHIKSELRQLIFDKNELKNKNLERILIPLVELWKRYRREAFDV